MAKIIVKDLGPVHNCAVDMNQFTILTGAQASGKSAIAKSIYFCRTIKDDIYNLILKRKSFGSDGTLFNDVIKILRGKFLQVFGTSKAMSSQMLLAYYYSDMTYIKVTLRLQEGYDFILPNYVWIDFSKDIIEFLRDPIKSQKMEKAISQIQNTIKTYHKLLAGYIILPRIIIHRTSTHDIRGKKYWDFKRLYPGIAGHGVNRNVYGL